MNQTPEEPVFPDTENLEDGDVCVDAATGTTYVVSDGNWVKANVRQTADARATFARHETGLTRDFIKAGIWT